MLDDEKFVSQSVKIDNLAAAMEDLRTQFDAMKDAKNNCSTDASANYKTVSTELNELKCKLELDTCSYRDVKSDISSLSEQVSDLFSRSLKDTTNVPLISPQTEEALKKISVFPVEKLLNMENNLADLSSNVTELKSTISSNSSSSPVLEVNSMNKDIVVDAATGMSPNTVSPRLKTKKPVCDPFVSYTENVVSSDVKNKLLDLLHQTKDDFKPVGQSRDVMYYGEFEYKYKGATHEIKDMPDQIKNLLEEVKANLPDNSSPLNSCLVTRYCTGKNSIPPHKDDELLIDPSSLIVTVSIGAERKMKFLDNSKTLSKECLLHDSSMLVTSRYAQDFWTHEIPEDDSESVRFSFTFRNISPKFINSTIIIGDSNTRLVKFGSEKGTLGPWMPGKRLNAAHIEDLPDATDIGPYRNIVIHTGINSINNPRYRRSNKFLVQTLETKCKEYIDVYPRAKIHISLLLPTKIPSINYNVREFNDLLLSVTYGYSNISVIDHSVFGEKLSEEHGRYDTVEGCPNKKDALHLGKMGLRLFAAKIKSSILTKKSQSRERFSGGRGGFARAAERGAATASSRGGGRRSPHRGGHSENRFTPLADYHDDGT